MLRPKKYPLNQDGVFDFNDQYSYAEVRHTTCCGACELFELVDGPLPSLAVLAAWQRGEVSFDDDFGYESSGNFKPLVLFTDRVAYRNGSSLAAYIRRHRLGAVIETRPVHNPNSRHRVQGWLWRIDRRRWESWVKKHVIFERENA